MNVHWLFSTGVATKGQYYVTLPDGRIQTVNYQADASGFVADVNYAGTPVVAAVPARAA